MTKNSFREKYVDSKARAISIEECSKMSFEQFFHAPAIKKLIPFPKRFLDLGTAVGNSCILFERLGCESHGIDLLEELARAARDRAKKAGVYPHFVVANAERLPYKSESFDLCIADSLLEHVENYEAVLDEAARVLRRGGMFALVTTNVLHPFQKEVRITSRVRFPFYPWLPDRLKRKFVRYCLNKRPDLVNYSEHPAVNWFTHTKLTSLLEKRGFRVIDYIDVVEPTSKKGIKRWLIPIIQRNRILKLLYRVYVSGVLLYGIKK